MATMEKTTIEISVENWRWLSRRKRRPGESFNDVLNRLRERYDAAPPAVEIDRDVDAAKGESDGVTPRTDEDVAATAAAVEENADSLVDDLDIPGSGEEVEHRRQAVKRLYIHLKDNETATRSDFLEVVDPDDLGYASEKSFWNSFIKSQETLSALPGVEPPAGNKQTWRYRPPEQNEHE